MLGDGITASGGCLCGDVHYEVRGPLRPVIACHCAQCRKTSGHFVAATSCKQDDIVIYGEESLTWYGSSDEAKRAFGSKCGGHLFWQNHSRDTVSIMAGTLDLPTGLKIAQHIYVQDKSDYYELGDGVPQFQTRDGDLPLTEAAAKD